MDLSPSRIVAVIAIAQFVPLVLFPWPLAVSSVVFFAVLLLLSAFLGWALFRRKAWGRTLTVFLQGFNVIVRLTVMLGMTSLIINTQFVKGSMVGALLLISGIGTEAFLALIAGMRYQKDFPLKPTRTKESVTVREAMVFFLPLILASFAQTFSRPGINAGLARTASPELALASYQVAYSYALIFVSLLWSCHQLVLCSQS